MIKRIYFFKGDLFWAYDPRPGTDRVVEGPRTIGEKWRGLVPPFTRDIDAVVNWGDGFAYLFKGDEYWKYDILLNRTATSTPIKIADGWTDFPADFKLGIDAAFNGGEGKAYFFKDSQYLRYNIANGAVDTPDPGTVPYPRAIAGPNGWRNLPSSFASGIDAAVNMCNGKIYFFKNGTYVRLTFATRTVDQVTPPYPYSIADNWPGLPTEVNAGVEWSHAGSAMLAITIAPDCEVIAGPFLGGGSIRRMFTAVAEFSSGPYPVLCGCAQYRQFVRGSTMLDAIPHQALLPDPNGGQPIPMLPIPASGALDENFLEDGDVNATVQFYGHRDGPPDPIGRYQPDQRSGCRYQMVDRPFVQGLSGQSASFDLDFKGVVIDACNGDEVITEKRWSVFCSGIIPDQ
ncbi:hemopexin repeat-containing protein [Nitrosomonas ureae]|uniref:Hemopexin n=1 Tax=Nitrosomonas ureae TaxID=44577 RepID=A0A1H5XAQ9_9PROT|nr:hemopexin repeat-containing protein [Nitrosomonas ureae]SEG08525.1 Hemopexin [Nitrosomonas ureae]